MNAPVEFVPVPPATPAEWRRRVERAAEHEPFKRDTDVLNFAIWAATAPQEASKNPASVETFRRARRDFKHNYLVPLRHDDVREVVALLAARGLTAPWWNVTPAQAHYRRDGM